MTNPLTERTDLRVVVPPEHRWLSIYYSGLLDRGVPIWDATLGDGRLRLEIGPPGPGRLVVVAQPLSTDQPVWKRTRRLGVSYEGRRHLSHDDKRSLVHVLQGLASFEPRMPEGLRGTAAIVRTQGPPEETLARLFPFVTVERTESRLGDDAEVLVRTVSACNQRCPFCSGPKHDKPPPEAVLSCIEMAGELLPGAMISITGGEPTLKSSFLEEVRAALSAPGVGRVQVQTNAVSFARRLDPSELPASPRLSFFVSLHGITPEVYDRCTGTEGQLDDALSGIDRLLAAGHDVVINTVVSSLNLDHLDELARELPEGPSGNRPSYHFSALICPEVNPGASDNLVRYSELVPAVARATALAHGRGFEVTSLLSSTHATVPQCVLPDAPERDARFHATAVQSESGLAAEGRDWVKAESCRQCAFDHECLGVPRAYAQRFGLSELRPIGVGAP